MSQDHRAAARTNNQLERGMLVRFVGQPNAGPAHQVEAVTATGMIWLRHMVGWFSPYLFVVCEADSETPQPVAANWRVPSKDDPFLLANAGTMFELLSGVHTNPPGYPINDKLLSDIQALFAAAYLDGIDTIAVSESGLQEPPVIMPDQR